MIGSLLLNLIFTLLLFCALPLCAVLAAIFIWRCVVPPPAAARVRTRGSLPLALAFWTVTVLLAMPIAFFTLGPFDSIVVNTYRAAAPASGPFPTVDSWARAGATEARQMLRLTGPTSNALIEIDFNTDTCIVADGQRRQLAVGPYDRPKLETWFESAGIDPTIPASQAKMTEIADFIARVRLIPEGDARFTGPALVDAQPAGFVPQPPTLRQRPAFPRRPRRTDRLHAHRRYRRGTRRSPPPQTPP